MTNDIQAQHQLRTFLQAVSAVQKQYSSEEIQHMWNATGLGKPAELTTIQRWLRPGPETKNPRFEPWIICLGAQPNPNTELALLVLQTHYRDNITTMTAEYNELFNASLTEATVQRYTNSGVGYEQGPPGQFVRFIRFIVKTKLK